MYEYVLSMLFSPHANDLQFMCSSSMLINLEWSFTSVPRTIGSFFIFVQIGTLQISNFLC